MAAAIVVVTTSSFCSADPNPRASLVKAGFEVHENPFRRRLNENEVIELLERHRPLGMIAGLEPLTEKVLKASSSHLKVISRCGIGLDNVDLGAAKRLGISVFNTPDAPCLAVAELTIALILSVLRHVAQSDRAMRQGQWRPLMGHLLSSRTVGIMGLGRIGAKVASLLRGFGCVLLGYDPREDLPPIEGLERVTLDTLLPRTNVVTLHVPLTAETRHFINAQRLSRLPRGAVLINTSRGGLVDEAALAEALKSGALSGAGIDVFEQEPYQGPLKDIPQAVLTAHMGSAAEESRVRMEAEATENLMSGLRSLGVL